MTSPPDNQSPHDRDESKLPNLTHKHILEQFEGKWAERLNIEQMFILIDGVLPFEACLYYQVIPLVLKGNRLSLGMVSPQDSTALEYVRRIISYLNYSLVPCPIPSKAHQAVLTAYLNHLGAQQTAIDQRQQLLSNTRLQRHTARARVEQTIDPSTQKTLILDSPDDLEEELASQRDSAQPLPPVVPPPPLPFKPTPPPASPALSHPIAQAPTSAPANVEQPPPQAPAPLIDLLPVLDIQAKYLSSPVEILAELPPAELLQELLGRVLIGGIGRLYFERQSQYGRVLWSQNGVLQSVVDRLEPTPFQGLINELKRMAHLSMLPLTQPKRIEIERLYKQTRLLLRFRFMPTPNGEEATMQVLRGAALKFYQRQQIANLERDALGIAKQLQLKINEIRDRARLEPNLLSAKLDALPALTQLLRSIESQLDALGINSDDKE
jgi:hypothetical protein